MEPWIRRYSIQFAPSVLFLGGLAFGGYTGYGSWKTGLVMAGLGTGLVGAIIVLGG